MATYILSSVTLLEQSPGAGSLSTVSSTLLSLSHPPAPPHSLPGLTTQAYTGSKQAVGRHLPDALADASLLLFSLSRPLLDGAFRSWDKVINLPPS